MESRDFTQTASKLPKLKLNRRIQIILICILVSLVFWFLIAMSKTYVDRFTFPVRYVNFPDQRVVVNDLPGEITLSIKTTGFKILSYRFTNIKEPVIIDVSSKLSALSEIEKNLMMLPSESLTADFVTQLGSEYTITGFSPDSIAFSFSNKMSKKVPVLLKSELTFERQYDSTSFSDLEPDSVVISGPSDLLSGIGFIQTALLKMDNVKATVNAKIDLVKGSLVTTNVDQVNVTIPVEKFTEGAVEVPVHAINVKPGYVLKTFPDKVSVRYQVSLSRYNEVRPDMFDVIVDASPLPEKKMQQLKVKLETYPVFVRSVLVEPEKTDYILRK